MNALSALTRFFEPKQLSIYHQRLAKTAKLVGLAILTIITINNSFAQGTGCIAGRFGIDAGLYSGVIEYGSANEPSSPRTNDWFQGVAGFGIIKEDNSATLQALLQAPGNPTYEERMIGDKVAINGGQIWIDAIYARDHFGGTGFQDATSYNTASKNGEDPAIWDPGQQNVLGKNDIIDVGGFMFRDGIGNNSNLYFVGLFNMAEPGGVSYMDFEFFVEGVQYTPGSGFTSGGPQLGHTSYNFDNPGNITKIGDFIFSVSLLSSGPEVEIRLWVSRTDWERLGGPALGSTPTFQWSGTFDGAFNGSPYGYAGIEALPAQSGLFCGYVNQDGETPLAPPWGSKGTKTNSYITNYIPYSNAEVGINLTAFGMDHSSLSGADPCFFPLNTFLVKTRASASFTAQLKDFAGPYMWGQPRFDLVFDNTLISCENETATITVNPQRSDVNYRWSTIDGNILNVEPYNPPLNSDFGNSFLVDPNDPNIILGVIMEDNPWEITVNEIGTYKLDISLPTNCPVESGYVYVGLDPNFPFFEGTPTFTYTVPCNDNDGTITVTASGATQPYTFSLYDGNGVLITDFTVAVGETMHTFTGLTPSDYRVDVKGVYACIVTTGPFTLPARIPVVITETITNVDCFGEQTGAINLLVSGGNPPLTYLWSTGATSQNLLNIGAGSYTVQITDSDNCVTSPTFEVTEPIQISATIIKVDDPGNAGEGSATVNASGGTPDYTYLWSKTGDPGFVFQPSNTANAVTNLSYGEYSVTVSDANGCEETFSVFIFEKEICDDGIDNDGDGLTDCDDPDCTPASTGPITASNGSPCVDPNGAEPYQYTYTYTVAANPDYDSYVWTAPASAVIVSGQGSNEITVAWISLTGGQICVRGKIYECFSTSTCINVIVDDVPPQPGDIILNNN